MLKILLIIFAVLVLLIIGLKRAFNNPYKLYIIFGNKGSGKSTYLTRLANYYNKKKMKVFSNTEIFGTYYIDPNDIGLVAFPENSVILLDEIGTIWHCRDYKSFPKYVRDFFKYQRQYKLIVYMTSQSFDIDKTLRNLCDEIYLSVSLADTINIMKPIKKEITISQDDDEDKPQFLTETYKFKSIFKWIFTFMPRYRFFFKSYNPPQLEPLKNTFEYKYRNASELMRLRDESQYFKFVADELKHGIHHALKDYYNSFNVTPTPPHLLKPPYRNHASVRTS